jgi:cystathionine beta-lyase/cystathionine gamma-synthase
MDLSYIINELGEDRNLYFNAIAPPIIQTSNFKLDNVAALRQAFKDEYGSYLYSRGINPTVDILRKKLAALDDAEDCLVFNSGAAAIFAAVLSQVKAGDHIVSVQAPYTWAQRMFEVILPRFNVSTTYIDGTNIDNFKNAIQPNTTLIYLESPNSWEFALQDLKAVAELAKANNIVTICDNSFCTPLYQQPIKLGIDLVLQSATKYISGHSDVVAGVLCGSAAKIVSIFNSEYCNIGSGISPFNAWLLIRGLRTLPMRLNHITQTTQKVIEFLKAHPKIERVIFPLDKAFKQYELATQQMQGGCGLLSFVLKANSNETIEKFCNSLQHILMAVSWGGHESLIIPRCSTIDPKDFDANNYQHRMARLYVGQEEADYIIKDLEQALATIP